MTLDLVVVGGGEHARVVIEAARSRPGAFDVLGFVDRRDCPETETRLGLRRLGSDDAAIRDAARAGAVAILGFGGVGPGRQRRDLVARLGALGVRWATVVHATAWISPTARVEPGAFVSAGALVNSGACVGPHTILNTGAVLEHDVILGAFAQAGPGAVIGGGAAIGEGTYLGLGCRIRDHTRVGQDVTVGMGAVVTRDVPDGWTVLGVPARRREARGPV